MQFSNTIFTVAVLIGACSAAAVPNSDIPVLDLTKRACNEDAYRKCTLGCPTGPGGFPIGCPIGCCIAWDCC